MITLTVQKSNKNKKKFMVEIDGSTVHFGHSDYSDYTIHKDYSRMLRYIGRHRKREDWTPDGVKTPGFWSRWLLWSEPDIHKAAKRTEKILLDKYKIKVII
tara:strand:+ start:103 stop:405 length:303 start_codon:yes stop_codon:yes gene_type:complete